MAGCRPGQPASQSNRADRVPLPKMRRIWQRALSYPHLPAPASACPPPPAFPIGRLTPIVTSASASSYRPLQPSSRPQHRHTGPYNRHSGASRNLTCGKATPHRPNHPKRNATPIVIPAPSTGIPTPAPSYRPLQLGIPTPAPSFRRKPESNLRGSNASPAKPPEKKRRPRRHHPS